MRGVSVRLHQRSMQTGIHFGLGAVTMVAAGAIRHFWELVDRGMSVRPSDPGLAGAIDRLVSIDAPTAIGSALGTALGSSIDGVDQLRAAIATLRRELEHYAETVLRRAGVPTRADINEVRRRLDEAAATVDRLSRAEHRRHD